MKIRLISTKFKIAAGLLFIPMITVISFFPDSFRKENAAILLSLCILFFALTLKKIKFLVLVNYFYIAMLCCFYSGLGKYIWANNDVATAIDLSRLVSESFMICTLFFLCFCAAKKETLVIVSAVISILVLIDAIYILFATYAGKPAYLLFNNPALDAGFIGISASAFYKDLMNDVKNRWIQLITRIIFGIIVAAPILTRSSTGILALGVSMSVYLFIKNKWEKPAILYALGVSALLSCVGYLMQGNILFDSDGRFPIWKMSLKYWWENINIWYGSGPGTYFLYGPSLQIDYAISHHQHEAAGFFWMHNDWLQILFETGIIGFCLVALLFGYVLWRSRKSPVAFSALSAFGAVALIQMPLRHLLFASYGALLVSWALLNEKGSYVASEPS